MISLIILMILLSFLQETWFSVNIILLILIARAYVVDDSTNLYLAFSFGLFLSILSGQQLGFLSLLYLLIIEGVQIIRRFQFASHPLMLFPVAISAIIINLAVLAIFTASNFDIKLLIANIVAIFPIYFVVRFWEERFIPGKDIKLKINN